MKKFAILADTSHNFDLKTAEKYEIYLLKYYLTLGVHGGPSSVG